MCNSSAFCYFRESPSTRREWIEIKNYTLPADSGVSPSTRREWIEMLLQISLYIGILKSPSTRREWIEIFAAATARLYRCVSLHTEGVD